MFPFSGRSSWPWLSTFGINLIQLPYLMTATTMREMEVNYLPKFSQTSQFKEKGPFMPKTA